jgi:hypothetical protein
MPSERVYAVDFKGGNLTPSLDTNGWGAMRVGVGPNTSSSADPQGLRLEVTADGTPGGIGVHAVLDEADLPLATRLTLQVEFDQPRGDPPASGTGSPEPWAVALSVKFGDEDFVVTEPMVPVTCQFRPNGTRLNTPGGLEGDQAAMLITPLDYAALSPGRFTLEHHFCGVNAVNRYAVGFGALSVGPPIREYDQRVYSNQGLSGGQQDWIGALGVVLVTLNGTGTIRVRLRGFAVSVW